MAPESRTSLTLEPRTSQGSRASRRLRRDGFVPGVVYGIGSETAAFQVDARKLRAVMTEGRALFDVEIDGASKQPVIVKESQRDPVKGNVVHIDLLRVKLDEKIQSTVPLEIEGTEEAPGVKEGGVLSHVTREVEVMALPTNIPDRIVADVSGLDIGENLTLEAVATPSDVEYAAENLEELVVATVTAPSKIEEPVEIEEEAELVGEDGEPLAEGEVPPEGEEGERPAEGEGGGEGGE